MVFTLRRYFTVVHRVVQKLYMLILMLKYHQDGILCRPYQVPCGTYNTISEKHTVYLGVVVAAVFKLCFSDFADICVFRLVLSRRRF